MSARPAKTLITFHPIQVKYHAILEIHSYITDLASL
jgi:hypothetical protein